MPAVIRRATGLRRRSPERHKELLAERPYLATLLPLVTVFQPVLCIHDQAQKGSCVGQALTAGAEARLKRRFSAVDLWTDARRRQGDLADADTGTDSEHAIESMIRRGLSPYVQGEDERPRSEDIRIAALDQELAADEKRIPVANEHRTIGDGHECLQSISDALQRSYDVVNGDGVRDPYFSLSLDDIADDSCLNNPYENGHEQRIVAIIAPNDTAFPAKQRGCVLYQNSWGEGWGGYTLPCTVTCTDGTVLERGTVLRGCILVKGTCVAKAWDRDALELTGL
jgi:hypothetical protein